MPYANTVNRLRDTTPFRFFVLATFVLALGVQVPAAATYSVLDTGKPGVPHLSALQRSWLRLIHDDPSYGPKWKYLRWTFVPEDPLPLVVFEYHGEDYNRQYFPIVGDVCNAFLDVSEATVIATPHFDRPCKPSEQWDVRGEKALLGWEP